jgi:hypothetical protein
MSDYEFESPKVFFETMSRWLPDGGKPTERHDIPAVSSPMIYTDIEDKIEQISERLMALEIAMNKFINEYWLQISEKEKRKWRKKIKRLKSPKQS